MVSHRGASQIHELQKLRTAHYELNHWNFGRWTCRFHGLHFTVQPSPFHGLCALLRLIHGLCAFFRQVLTMWSSQSMHLWLMSPSCFCNVVQQDTPPWNHTFCTLSLMLRPQKPHSAPMVGVAEIVRATKCATARGDRLHGLEQWGKPAPSSMISSVAM